MYNFTQKTFQNIYGEPGVFSFRLRGEIKEEVEEEIILLVKEHQQRQPLLNCEGR
jgi:hypothetical protein